MNPKPIFLVVALSMISSWAPASAQTAVPIHEPRDETEARLQNKHTDQVSLKPQR